MTGTESGVKDRGADGRGIALSAEEVVVSFGATRALRGLSLRIEPGEVVAVTGPSGSGKSTILQCLAGLVVPDEGVVRIADMITRDLAESARTRLRRTDIGVLFQFGELVPELTAAENVLLPLLFGGLRRAEARQRAMDWLARLGVADRGDERVRSLSGGEAQRVALARALVIEPSVLLADEPTGALDTPTGERVMAELLGAVRGSGATAVIVTHESRVAAYADREIHLRDGAVLPQTGQRRPDAAATTTVIA